MTFFVPLQGITTIIPSHKSSLQPTSNPNIPPLSLILFIFEKNTQQVMKRIIYIIFCTFLISCGQYNAELENALKLAGENRGELEKVLYHYSQNPSDFDGIDKQTPLHLLYLYFQYETDKNHNTYKHNRFGKTFGYVYNKNCIAA